ncbi:APC family permease [Edwardsiella tarda]|uniref:APC family permease n=1 Tax=Edwardsiella tarda TaxID=636 RepID=UPI003F657B44
MEASTTTKNLRKTLGFKDLLGVAIGQIIGAGIMSLMGIAIGMTGRSVPFAFLIAALLSIVSIIPTIIVGGTVRLRGGHYTMSALLAGKQFAGVYIVLFIISNMTIALMALSFSSYLLAFLPTANQAVVATICLTVFYMLNMAGIDKMAKVQNLIIFVMCIALGVLVVFGMPHITANYFSEDFMPKGYLGLMSAGSLLTFATGGAFVIINLSAESKNPTKDIPWAIIISTLLVAVLYGAIAFVAAGVLPVKEVANQSLAKVAKHILPNSLYLFFMVCGAMFALMSTLNATFASATKPVLQACVDGWFPKRLGYIHPKYKTPMVLLTIFYFIGLVPILIGFDIGILGSLTNIIGQIIFIIINIAFYKLPNILPDEWGRSKFKIKKSSLLIVSALSVIGCLLQIVLLAKDMSIAILMGNGFLLILSIIYTMYRYKTGKVNMEISYESE